MKPQFLLFSFLCLPFFATSQNGLSFDGTNDYVQSTYAGIAGTANRTVEAWIKTTKNYNPSTGGVQGVILDYGSFTTGARFTFNVLWSNAIRLEVGGNGVSGTIPVNDGNWHHVAAVFTGAGNSVALYVDGVLDAQGTLTVNANTGTTNTVTLGRRIDNINYFEGAIDEIRLWNYAKTQSEIQSSMNTELCATANLVLYYNFNQGTAGGNNMGQTTLLDNSGNGHNGTLNNFALTGSSSNWVTGKSLTPTNSNATATINVTECGSYTSPSGNYTWTVSNTYMDTIPQLSGCGDSIITINLTINNNTTATHDITACRVYHAPNGITYASSQTIVFTIPNAAGCDSTVTENITIVNPFSSQNVTACDSFVSSTGIVYTTSQFLIDTLPSATVGCDSFVNINLTIQTVDATLTNFGSYFEANTVGATYQWYDCDNSVFLQGQTGQVFTPTQTGNYAVQVTANGCTQMSDCAFFTIGNTIDQTLANKAQIYPNPTFGTVAIDLPVRFKELTVKLITVEGKTVFAKHFTHTDQIILDLDQPQGFYLLVLEGETGIGIHKLIINQ